MGRGQAVKVVTLDILNIFTPSEQVIQILRFTPLQPNRKKIPIIEAKNGSIHQVTLVRWTSLLKLSSLIESLFLFNIIPMSDITLSAGVEVPCTDKYFLASLVCDVWIFVFV